MRLSEVPVTLCFERGKTPRRDITVRVMWGVMKTVKRNCILCVVVFWSEAPIRFGVVLHLGKHGIHCVQSIRFGVVLHLSKHGIHCVQSLPTYHK
jgi:hypothetical protein